MAHADAAAEVAVVADDAVVADFQIVRIAVDEDAAAEGRTR